jgi:hypothetical protein
MPEESESPFQILFRHVALIQARQAELGAYPGDGPTAEQASALAEALRPICEAEAVLPSVLWTAFHTAVDIEMTWLFPEKDPFGLPVTAALRQVQDFTGKAIETAKPDMGPSLEKYASLAIVANAARRTERLHGNKIIWRLVLARVLYRIGRFLSG